MVGVFGHKPSKAGTAVLGEIKESSEPTLDLQYQIEKLKAKQYRVPYLGNLAEKTVVKGVGDVLWSSLTDTIQGAQVVGPSTLGYNRRGIGVYNRNAPHQPIEVIVKVSAWGAWGLKHAKHDLVVEVIEVKEGSSFTTPVQGVVSAELQTMSKMDDEALNAYTTVHRYWEDDRGISHRIDNI